MNNRTPDLRGSEFIVTVIFRGKGAVCESCRNRFYSKFQGFTDTQYKNITEIVWSCSYCSYCTEKCTTDKTQELKLFKTYAADIVRTVKGNPLEYFVYTKSLHKHLQFSLETPKCNENLSFLELKTNNEGRIIVIKNLLIQA